MRSKNQRSSINPPPAAAVPASTCAVS
jgi:hypothetical protein